MRQKLFSKKITYFFIFVLAIFITGIVAPSFAADKEANLVYVNWAEGVAYTHLAKVLLEEKMGYDVKITAADVGPVYTSIARGDMDAFMETWLPVLHKDYVEKYKEKIVDLGHVYEGTISGWVVPDYVPITKISELNDHKKEFKGRIVGIDAGAGIMKTSEKVIEAYNLDFKLLASSGPAMTASLKDAIKRGKWIVVIGWRPHWMFGRWRLFSLFRADFEVQRLHMPAKGPRVAHQAVRQALSQMPAQLAEAVGSGRVLGHCHGPLDHFPTIHSDKDPYRTLRQQAEGGARGPAVPVVAQYRHPLPQGLHGGGSSVVGKCIQGDINLIVVLQVRVMVPGAVQRDAPDVRPAPLKLLQQIVAVPFGLQRPVCQKQASIVGSSQYLGPGIQNRRGDFILGHQAAKGQFIGVSAGWGRHLRGVVVDGKGQVTDRKG